MAVSTANIAEDEGKAVATKQDKAAGYVGLGAGAGLVIAQALPGKLARMRMKQERDMARRLSRMGQLTDFDIASASARAQRVRQKANALRARGSSGGRSGKDIEDTRQIERQANAAEAQSLGQSRQVRLGQLAAAKKDYMDLRGKNIEGAEKRREQAFAGTTELLKGKATEDVMGSLAESTRSRLASGIKKSSARMEANQAARRGNQAATGAESISYGYTPDQQKRIVKVGE